MNAVPGQRALVPRYIVKVDEGVLSRFRRFRRSRRDKASNSRCIPSHPAADGRATRVDEG